MPPAATRAAIAALSGSESALGSAARSRPTSLPSRGPSTGRLGLIVAVTNSDAASTKTSRFTFNSSSSISAVAAQRLPIVVRAHADQQFSQRLPHLNPRIAPRGSPERGDALHLRYRFVEGGDAAGTVRVRPTREMHRLGRAGVHRDYQVAVDRVGEIGRERRRQPRHRDESLVERVVGRGLIRVVLRLPEAAAAAPDVPVAQLLDEVLDRARRVRRRVGVEIRCHPLDETVQGAQQPAVQLRALSGRRVCGIEAVDVGVGDEEGVGVPERQDELALRLPTPVQLLNRRGLPGGEAV